MTRFEKELSGALGAYWKKSAEKELEKVREELEQGLITIDENGVARNRIGRVLILLRLEQRGRKRLDLPAEWLQAPGPRRTQQPSHELVYRNKGKGSRLPFQHPVKGGRG